MDSLSPTSGRTRAATRTYAEEDQAISLIAHEAEMRLAARRAEREAARKIRQTELEKQKKELDDMSDKDYARTSRELATKKLDKKVQRASSGGGVSRSDSRAGSEASEEDHRDVKAQMREVDEKYKKAMVSVAQLENEKQTLLYELDLLKDSMEELTETAFESERQQKEACRQLEHKKRDYKELEWDLNVAKKVLTQREMLIKEHGLTLVGGEELAEESSTHGVSGVMNGETKEDGGEKTVRLAPAALLSSDMADFLDKAGTGTLDVRLRRFVEERKELQSEVKRLKQELEKERERAELAEKYSTPRVPIINGPDVQMLEAQHAMEKQLSDYKVKLQKQDQEITTLQGTVARLESQVKRFKTAADTSEAMVDDLKQERRKLQRELREAQTQLEDCQTSKNQLERRLEKIKSARSGLVK